MANDFDTPFQPQGAGAQYAFTMSACEEDELFRQGAERSVYRQYWSTYLPHHAALLVQTFNNNGAGQAMEAVLTKAPGYYHTTYWVSEWKGIQPNLANGDSQVSYVNGRGFHAVKSAEIRVANQLIHTTDGLTAFLAIDLDGQLKTYGKYGGVHFTRQGLIEDSSKNSVLYTLAKGWSFADPDYPSRAWSIGGVAFHNVSCKVITRDISELIVNYSASRSNLGIYSLPLEVATSKAVSSTSVQFRLATKCVFVDKDEEFDLLRKDVANQSMFREYVDNPAKTIVASNSTLRHEIDIDARGSVAHIIVTIRSAKDLANNNWMKDCADDGALYVKNCMILTGATAYEDGLPASYYCGPKVTESFGTHPHRHSLVFSYENNSRAVYPTGQLTTTNMEKFRFAATFPPHDVDLVVNIKVVTYNGWYTVGGTCSRLWA